MKKKEKKKTNRKHTHTHTHTPPHSPLNIIKLTKTNNKNNCLLIIYLALLKPC